MPTIKVVLDTNVIISAILFGGKPREILQLVIHGKIHAFLSPSIFTELKDVLARPKFRIAQEAYFPIVREVEDLFSFVFPQRKVNLIKDDPDDNAVLECAIEADVDYILTGDSHLLDLECFEGIRIISPAVFLNE